MKIPAKTEYAIKALLELSLHWPKQEPLAINTIAVRQGIPLKFLTQILLNLKSLGLVESSRGKQGGYILKKNPARITLADVVGNAIALGAIGKKGGSVVNKVLSDIDALMVKHLHQTTFEDIAKQERALVKTPMYAI